ncbi:hypothetical protein LPB19_04185 [Marinobacter salinisoli]|uniref:Transmembrane protein n=2 Tax=Marinobacter salinisoli TaxID=2769486 RepID=A0ABX7MYC4_9GAMM|nr:hypothetical protein LPB19_04185 [Marinobacter salinisoli]
MAKQVSDQDGPTPEQVRRGRRTAMLLFALGFGPMIFATIMFYTGWLNPAGHTNNGTLIQPPVPVANFHLETASGQPLAERFGPDQSKARWMLMVVAADCDSKCEQLLYLTRQVNIALGKNANRVARAAALGSLPADLEARWSDEYRLMERLTPVEGRSPAWPAALDLESEPSILLIDPFGNAMMRYGADNTGKEMLKDLKHLLKLSQIG